MVLLVLTMLQRSKLMIRAVFMLMMLIATPMLVLLP